MLDFASYRVPSELTVTTDAPTRVLVIGSCLSQGLPSVIEALSPGTKCDHILFNNVADLSEPPYAIETYDFQIIQIAMRSLMPEGMYFRLSHAEVAAHDALFERVVQRLDLSLRTALLFNRTHGLRTYVLNFLVPQTNPMGRLLGRYDIRNPVFFFEQLNKVLHDKVSAYRDTFIVDTDQVASALGKVHISDDVLWQTNHASALSDSDFELDQARLHPPTRASEIYPLDIYGFVRGMWFEILAMHRTISKTDGVKLVIVDLDDTLWRGVYAEEGPKSVEGWPLGVVEALLYLKRRGVLLAIVSKNDADNVSSFFNNVYGPARLRLDDFAAAKINWRSKADNIREIIAEVNVLPSSVLFIDDNPLERSIAKDAFPDLRVLGEDLYSIRRILLWSAETQVAHVSNESTMRTEMVQAQIKREEQRASMTREEFLAGLDVKIMPSLIESTADPKFARALELINKTNQFNTTGQRLTAQQLEASFAEGTVLFAFDVQDEFSEYGLVVVVVIEGSAIKQFVMSCRVFGLDVEIATLNYILNTRQPGTSARALFTPTGKNNLCANFYPNCGFREEREGVWAIDVTARHNIPDHIRIDEASLIA